VPVEIAGPKLKEMQAQKIGLEAELAEEPPEEKIVGLPPAALQPYEMHVSELQRVFGDGVTPHTEEAAQRIRNLIARVTITPKGTRASPWSSKAASRC
jgi:site-specific DNA recombinase